MKQIIKAIYRYVKLKHLCAALKSNYNEGNILTEMWQYQ